MLYHAFPDLDWLKKQAESRFAGATAWNGEPMSTRGWPTVMLNVRSGSTVRDNIPGPLSLFSNLSGKSEVTVNNRTTRVGSDYFFIGNNTQRYTLEITKKNAAEIFNIHFGECWFENILGGMQDGFDKSLDQIHSPNTVEFYNKLYPKDDIVRSLQLQLSVPGKIRLEREELLTRLIVHLLRINRNEKLRLDHIDAMRLSTKEEIVRRLHLATDHIFSNYHTDISLDELSRISMLSKFHFLRAFRQVFGIPPHMFLNEVRLGKAKDLLIHSGLEVSEISKAIGIKDASSFSRMFKKKIGVYPTAYRG
jgi:AraC family transcriptional regulator